MNQRSSEARVEQQAAIKVAEPKHKPELDGIRGIALLAVMLSHGGPFIMLGGILSRIIVYSMIPGWAGVELFFVLSGFLITGILLRTKSATNYFSSFYARRFLRIFPIYYVTLTVGLLVAAHNPWWNSVIPPLIKTRIAYYFYLQNIPWFWPKHLFILGNAFGHFWSLAVEEQFYLIWPLLIWLLPEGAVVTICFLGLAVALPLRFYIVHLYAEDFTAMALTSSRIDGLLVGVLLAIYFRRGTFRMPWAIAMSAVGASIIGFIAVFHRHELVATYWYMPTIGISGFAFLSGGLLAFSQLPVTGLNSLLCMRWLRAIGKYSYGMYIYHIPIYAVMNRILSSKFHVALPLPLHLGLPYVFSLIVITFLFAKFSFDFFESRLLGLKRYFVPAFSH
jgi:peptidoglycan/LPS O-acetylase OafA/YrhL